MSSWMVKGSMPAPLAWYHRAVHLVRADEAGMQARDRLSFDAWGARHSLEQYLERQARLREHVWARDALVTWLLVDDGGAALSSCETFRMQSFQNGAAGVTLGVE